MKVLVFSSLYPNNMMPNYGVFVKERMSNVAKIKGCSIEVVAPVPYYPPIPFGWRKVYSQIKSEDKVAGVRVYHPRYFMTPKVLMSLYGFFMFLSVLLKVKKIQKGFDFDVIDAHYVYPDGFAAILLGHFLRKPVVISARGSDINLYKNIPIIRYLLRYALNKADRVIAVCHSLKEEIREMGIPNDRISVIPNGIDTEKFHAFPTVEARKKLGLPVDNKIILSVGNLISLKGFDIVIRAIKILTKEYHENSICLVIVGEGPLKMKLKKLITSLSLDNYVRLVGAKPHDELYEWYNAADVFCLASSREGWPNVLMEALACGTPVVAANVCGIPEIVNSGKIGLLSERGDREFAEQLLNALRNNWDQNEMINYARRHTWDYVADSVSNVFRSVLDARRK